MKNSPNPPEKRTSGQSSAVDLVEPPVPVEVKSLKITNKKPAAKVNFDPNVHGRIESNETGKNVFVRDKDANDDISELRVLDAWQPPGDKSTGVDPYNTVTFDRSEFWKAKSTLRNS